MTGYNEWSPTGGGSLQELNHRGSLPTRGPGTSTLWNFIYCMQSKLGTVAQKGHTCKLKMLLQIKNSKCKLEIVHANEKYFLQIKYSTCRLKIVLQIGQLHDDDI